MKTGLGPRDKYVRHVIRAAFSDMPQPIRGPQHTSLGQVQYTPTVHIVDHITEKQQLLLLQRGV